MFSGIIEAVGHVAKIEDHGGDKRVTFATDNFDLSDVKSGDSIAVNGVCLTITGTSGGNFAADISGETLSCTTFGLLQIGTAVNLEKSLRMTDRLHGHLVTGHVDGIGTVRERFDDARSARLVIKCPVMLLRYISAKGSVSMDGVSLTVNERRESGFEVNIIPHTLEQTIMADYQAGTRVNIEVDIIARYLESLVQSEK